MSGMGEVPRQWQKCFETAVYGLLQKLPQKNIQEVLKDIAETYAIAPYIYPPVKSVPFKVADIAEKIEPGANHSLRWKCPQGHAAVLTKVKYLAEALCAYSDLSPRLIIGNKPLPTFELKEYQEPSQISHFRITFWQDESVELYVENTSAIVPHWVTLVLEGYYFPVAREAKDLYHMRQDALQW